MKKLVSVLLVLCMAFSALPVFAENTVEDVLLTIKSKVDIPEELTEFEYAENTYDNSIRYDFLWRNEDYTKELHVSSDVLGEIVSYNYYEEIDYSASRHLIGYTLSDAQTLAEEFVKKTLPEFDNREMDVLYADESFTTSSYGGRYKSFAFTFKRNYGTEAVESNYVTVRARATKDKMYVQSLSASLDDFNEILKGEEHLATAKDIGEKEYTEKFPLRLYYATDYSEDEEKVSLFYSIDKGFVSRVDGEVVTQTMFDRYENYSYSAQDSVTESAMGSSNKTALTEAEIKALEEMKSLVPISEVESKLRKLELLNITDDMKISSTSTNKQNEGYSVRFVLEGEKQRTTVTFNGETGEVTRIYSYKKNSSENEIKGNKKVIDENTITSLAKELAGEKVNEANSEFTESDNYSSLSLERVVNGVPYPENNIGINYSIEDGFITSYYIYWDEDVSAFPSPEEVISLEKAEEIMFSKSPLYNNLVKTETGYIPAVSIPKAVTINAITGKELYASTEEKQQYTDIETHWAKDMINALWEHDIYFSGEKFNPDSAITVADMLVLFRQGIQGRNFPLPTKEYAVDFCVTNGYIDERDPDSFITREDAFEVFVKFLGYGDIAVYDIYKSSYVDLEGDGSAEILKAMGVLIGDTARPADFLTRAEAAVMIYRYLS